MTSRDANFNFFARNTWNRPAWSIFHQQPVVGAEQFAQFPPSDRIFIRVVSYRIISRCFRLSVGECQHIQTTEGFTMEASRFGNLFGTQTLQVSLSSFQKIRMEFL